MATAPRPGSGDPEEIKAAESQPPEEIEAAVLGSPDVSDAAQAVEALPIEAADRPDERDSAPEAGTEEATRSAAGQVPGEIEAAILGMPEASDSEHEQGG